MLRLREQDRISDPVDGIAPMVGAMSQQPSAENLPGVGIESSLRHQTQVALLVLLINGNLEGPPIKVGRLEPAAAAAD
jgi:hypothetical protein